MDTPDDQQPTSAEIEHWHVVANNVGRHFVSLSCLQQLPDGEPRVLVFSGFVVEIAGEWCYVTAGHVVRNIRSAMEAGSTFTAWRLGDQTAAGSKFGYKAIPYHFEADRWRVVEDPEQGLDYAAIHLGGLYRKQLEAGGVMAFAKHAWSDHRSPADHWGLAGIPSKDVVYNGKTLITVPMFFVKLTPVSEPPPGAGQRAENQFYARLLEGSEDVLRDIDGMSGGPVIKVHRTNGEWRYGLLGVQSAWYPSTRTIAACPFASFGRALEQAIAPVLSGLSRDR